MDPPGSASASGGITPGQAITTVPVVLLSEVGTGAMLRGRGGTGDSHVTQQAVSCSLWLRGRFSRLQ